MCAEPGILAVNQAAGMLSGSPSVRERPVLDGCRVEADIPASHPDHQKSVRPDLAGHHSALKRLQSVLLCTVADARLLWVS